MSHDSPTLALLARQLLGCADTALLDASLDGMRAHDEEVQDLLRSLHEAGEARTLRELCGPATLERWQSEVATPREANLMRAQLERWLGRDRLGPDDPERLAQVEPPPAELEALLAWARAHALLGELTAPAREALVDDEGVLTSRISLVELCMGQGLEELRGASLLATQRLEQEARAYLLAQAQSRAALPARAALWERSPREPGLRVLHQRLVAVVDGTSLEMLASARFVPARRVHVDSHVGVAHGALSGGAPGPIEVELHLSGYEHRALVSRCARCRKPACLHVRALAARLVDACLDEEDALHESLCALSAEPSWKRFVRAISEPPPEARPARDQTRERLCFRADVDIEGAAGPGRVSVSVAIQKKQASGQWSAGRAVSASEGLRSRALTDRDRAVLEAIAALRGSRSAQPLVADATLLRALIDHPRVELAQGGALRVQEEIVHVEMVEQPDGVVPRVTLAGAPVATGAAPWDFLLLHLSRDDGRLVFAPPSAAVRRLLGAMRVFHGPLPAQSWPQLAPWLESLKTVARVSAPISMRGSERRSGDKLLLRIEPGRDEGLDLELSVRAVPLAPLWSPGRGPELVHGLSEGVPVFARRDLKRERALCEELTDTLGLARFLELDSFSWRIETDQEALEFLSRVAHASSRLEVEWAERARSLRISGSVGATGLSVNIRRKGAWLAIGGSGRVFGANRGAQADIAIGRLLEAARQGQRFVPVGSGSFVEIERELFERLARAQLCTSENLAAPKLPLAALPYLDASLQGELEAVDDTTREWLVGAREPREEPLSPRWQQTLRSYQQEGARWLLERAQWAPGACLADEMGLGKTVQTLALLDARRELGPALVVAPTSVVDNWASELSRFAPELKVHVHRGASRTRAPLGPGEVVLISYDGLVRDLEGAEAPRVGGAAYATVVADEAQYLKNARTARARALMGVEAGFRVALSGTPIENRLADLWSLFQFVAPGLLGSWSRFRARFAVPIEKFGNEERAELLRSLVAPLLLRRTKARVEAQLPERTELVHRVELSVAEQDLYAAAVRKARRAMRRGPGEGAKTIRVLAELTKLRQLACHPRLVVDDARVESSKTHALLSLLEDVLPRGHRVLVFSQFTRHLDLVREALDARGIVSLSLEGSTPRAERTRRVAAFQEGAAPVFLISLKAGGTGLNLTAADYVVHLDPWWNPSAEDQASDRAHRIGQVRPVTIVRLVSEGTIEERVLAMHADKRELADSIVSGDVNPSLLDDETLAQLLRS